MTVVDVSEWILTADRKPKHGQLVVKGWDATGNVWAGKHIAHAKYESFDRWMPLPEWCTSAPKSTGGKS